MLIGITGRAGAGKDTVADYLNSQHGYKKISMAGPLKAMLAAVGLPEPADRGLKEAIIPGFDFSWRQAAQRLGTEWGRGLDQHIWLKLMEMQLSDMGQMSSFFIGREVHPVISDIRFENEADMVRRRGGVVWHIVGRQVELGADAGHASEAGIKFHDNDHMFNNKGTLDDLYSAVDRVLGELKL